MAKTTKTERVIKSVKASMAVEGLTPSKEVENVGRQYLQGKISKEDAVTKIRSRHLSSLGKPSD